ncbi:stage II sporulation protein E (SpoIIE) [Trinickia dabaoshanensis]|uniref:Stage II sporulation protein E (SpoIIE) n=1 Tax=Trinickia dabaoshanensis TaxID=564714 RepID=A0A2N7VKJ6_9BURK|nr:SpoIIE family protein phosphatase [Trinickia dabaoshanensis]PMS17665.1 stage II sporulation protein E (SpoIIE) [Trinickia dabaoshanensis]
MKAVVSPGRSVIEWGWAGRALEHVSGDMHAVVEHEHGALVALLDGLGHGPDAAKAVSAAMPVMEAHAGASLTELVQRCHEALRKTRGAVMSVAWFDACDASMTWAGVGNVDSLLIRAGPSASLRDEAIAARGGVVGYRLPSLRVERHPVARGDTLVMATDGIQSSFGKGITMQFGVQEIAESILARYAKGTDDAHVLVARYVGAPP